MCVQYNALFQSISVLLWKSPVILKCFSDDEQFTVSLCNTLLSLIAFLEIISISHESRKIKPSVNNNFKQFLNYVCWIWQLILLLNIVILYRQINSMRWAEGQCGHYEVFNDPGVMDWEDVIADQSEHEASSQNKLCSERTQLLFQYEMKLNELKVNEINWNEMKN